MQSCKIRILGFPPIAEREVDALARKFLQSTLTRGSGRVLHVDTRQWAAAGRDGPIDVILVGENVVEECQRLDGSAFEVDRDLVLCIVEIVTSGGPTASSAVQHISEHMSHSADSESSGVRSKQRVSPELMPHKSSYSVPAATVPSEDSSDRLTTRSAPPVPRGFRFLSSLFGGTSSSSSSRDVAERSSEADPILAPKSQGQGGLADSLTAGPHDGPLAWSTGSEMNEQDRSMLFGAQKHGLISSRSRRGTSSPPPSTAVPSGSDSSSAAAETRSVPQGESTSGSMPTSEGNFHRRPEAEWPARPPMLRELRSAQQSQSMAALPSDDAKRQLRIHDAGFRRFSDTEHVYRGSAGRSPSLHMQKLQPLGNTIRGSAIKSKQSMTTGPQFARTAASTRPPSHLSRRPGVRMPESSPEGPAAVEQTAASAPGRTKATAATLSAGVLQVATQAEGMAHARDAASSGPQPQVAASMPMQPTIQGAGQAQGAPMAWMPQEYHAHGAQPEGLLHAVAQGQPRPPRQRGISGQHRLYVSGVPTAIEDETIEMHFSQFGEVQDVYRPVYYRSETGHLQTKGGSYRTQFRRDFCFVTMRTAEEVERCIRTSPRIIAGMPIKDIKAAKDRGGSAAAGGHAVRRTGSGPRFPAGRHAPAAAATQQQYHGGMAPQMHAAQVAPLLQGGMHPFAGPGGQLQGFPAPFIGGNTQVMMSSPMSILGPVPPQSYSAVPAPMGLAAMGRAPGFMPVPGGNMHAASGVGPVLAPTGTLTHPANIQAVLPAVPTLAGAQPAAPTTSGAAQAALGKEMAKAEGND